MHRLIEVKTKVDIPAKYKGTAIELLLEYQNLERPLDVCNAPQLLVGMCMDNRKHLRIPDNFAFIIRAGGANLRYSEFKVSYAIGVGGVKSLALIGHNHCGMVNLCERKEQFIEGLVNNAGWKREDAQAHFEQYSEKFEIFNEIDFVLSEVVRLRKQYPKIVIAPLLYLVENNRLYFISEEDNF